MSAASLSFPNWVLLERFVFRRDNDKAFPDDKEAPIRASGSNSQKDPFRLAFRLADPPAISRLYVQLPGFLVQRNLAPLDMVATHHHLALFRLMSNVNIDKSGPVDVQDFFICNASAADDPSSSSSSLVEYQLKALPPCTEPYHDELHFRPRPPLSSAEGEDPNNWRLLKVRSMGLLCLNEEEFAVAELKICRLSRSKIQAQLCLLRSSCASTGPGGGYSGSWDTKRLPIDVQVYPNDLADLFCWQTDDVIPFDSLAVLDRLFPRHHLS